MAEGVGFEPTDLPVCGFQDRCLKPLGHPSTSCFFNTGLWCCQGTVALHPRRGRFKTCPYRPWYCSPRPLIPGCSQKSIFRAGEWFSQSLRFVGRVSRAILGA